MKTILFFVCWICSYAFAQSDVIGMISDTAKLRAEAETTLSATPYRAKEHQVIKNYFLGVKDFIEQIKVSPRTNKRFNSYLAGQEMSKFCSDVLISLKDWDQIKVNCTRNRFFLCTEDVNEYSETKKGFSEILSVDLFKIFQSTPECQ